MLEGWLDGDGVTVTGRLSKWVGLVDVGKSKVESQS